MNIVFSDKNKMSFDSCVNNDVVGMIFRLCTPRDQIAFARVSVRVKRVYIRIVQTVDHNKQFCIINHVFADDEVGLFKIIHDYGDIQFYWFLAVSNCAPQIMTFLLRRWEPNWNKHHALVRLCTSKHPRALPALCALLADPRTTDAPSYAIDLSTRSGNVDAIRIMIRDPRFMNLFPAVGFRAAIVHDIPDVVEEMVARYPRCCEEYIYHAVVNKRTLFVQHQLQHVSTETLTSVAAYELITEEIKMLLQDEIQRRN
jgi:hypothetical protein